MVSQDSQDSSVGSAVDWCSKNQFQTNKKSSDKVTKPKELPPNTNDKSPPKPLCKFYQKEKKIRIKFK